MITSQAYEPDGQTKTIAYANGTSTTRRWLTRIVTRDANNVVTLDSTYTRDNAGRILSIDGLNARDDWTYISDDLDRLASATNLGDPALSEMVTYVAQVVRQSPVTPNFPVNISTCITLPIATGVE